MNEYKPVIRDILIQVIAAIAFLIGIPSIFTEFGVVSDVYFKSLGIIGVSSLLLGAYAYGVTYALIRLLRDSKDKPQVSEIVKIIKALENEGRFSEVISIGSNLGRHLWVTGRFLDRIEIGIMVWRSAGIVEDHQARLSAAVDMIGWTSEVVGESKQAEVYLKRAIKIAENRDYPYYLAKALRHLGGIYYRHNQFSEALVFLEKAENAHLNIIDEVTRMEMMAGIHYGRAECYLGSNDCAKALQENGEAQRIYDAIKDEIRKIKCISQEGRILLVQSSTHPDNLLDVYSIFLKAKGIAEMYSRTEQLAEVAEGLGDYYMLQDDLKNARREYKNARQQRKMMGFIESSSEMMRIERKLFDTKGKNV